jgi:hypothetical protein
LVTQDWFSVSFSEIFCRCLAETRFFYSRSKLLILSLGVNPMQFSTKTPLHYDEETMQLLPLSTPIITTYSTFLFKAAALIPALQDQLSEVHSKIKYEQILRFGKMMRDIVISQFPSCLNSQTAIESSWPRWVTVARRCLTITSAHKIIVRLLVTFPISYDSQSLDNSPKVPWYGLP